MDPPTFASAIKCHQKSTSNSAGSSVGSLAPPRATPRLGGVYVSCQYFPCSFVLALRELGLRLGVKAQLPLRASSRGVLPGAGALAGYRHSKFARWRTETAAASRLQNEIGTFVVLRSLHTRYRDPVWHTGMNRVDRLTRVLSDTASYVTEGSPVLELLRERGYTAPRDPSLTQAMFGPVSRDTSLCESMFGVHKLTACDLHRCVLCFISPYLQVLFFLYPRYEGNTDPAFGSLHVCDREEHHR